MESYQQPQHLNPYLIVNPRQEAGERDRDRDRLLQWSSEETKEFLAMRGELDRSFMETKRNKQLWEAISAGLQHKGFHRTPDQCKSKWKNLVTRFKGNEATEGDGNRRQFPFYEDMRKIYSDRSLALEKGKGKAVQVQAKDQWEEEDEEAGEEDEEEEENKAFPAVAAAGSNSKRRRRTGAGEEVPEIGALREFARRQLEMEARWLEEAEAREAERRAKDEEWWRAMASLQAERVEAEMRWREREEARRAREEARAERRHGVVMALLEKLWEKGFY